MYQFKKLSYTSTRCEANREDGHEGVDGDRGSMNDDEMISESVRRGCFEENFWVFSMAKESQQRLAGGLGISALVLLLTLGLLMQVESVQKMVSSEQFIASGLVQFALRLQSFMLLYSLLYLVSCYDMLLVIFW